MKPTKTAKSKVLAKLLADQVPEDMQIFSPRERITTALVQAIRSGHLQPGMRIMQQVLADHFAVSRMPVREALRVLQAQGWLKGEAYRGYTVEQVQPTHIGGASGIGTVRQAFPASQRQVTQILMKSGGHRVFVVDGTGETLVAHQDGRVFILEISDVISLANEAFDMQTALA